MLPFFHDENTPFHPVVPALSGTESGTRSSRLAFIAIKNPPSHQVIRGIVITSLRVFSRSLQDRASLSVYTRRPDAIRRLVPCR